MRVLLMLDWNAGRGGAEAHALRLREGLLAAGDEVRLLVSSVGSAGDGLADYVTYGTEARAAQSFLQIANPLAAATVRRAVREFRPDVVWINMFALQLSPAAVFALGAVPKVLFVTDYKIVCPQSTKLLPNGQTCDRSAGLACLQSGCLSLPHWLRDQPRYALIRRAIAGCDRVMVCSEWLRQVLAQDGIASEVLSVPVGTPPADRCRTPDPLPTLLYCGRLGREKGVDLLLRAFAQASVDFPQARLRIAGQGPLRVELEALAASLGIVVEFLGWRDPAELEPEFARAWALAAPSRWAEPQGLVAVEAIVRGLPAIVPHTGGLAEIVNPAVSGWHFASGDVQSLANCIRLALIRPRVLSADTVSAARLRYSVGPHVAALQEIFRATTDLPPVKLIPINGGETSAGVES